MASDKRPHIPVPRRPGTRAGTSAQGCLRSPGRSGRSVSVCGATSRCQTSRSTNEPRGRDPVRLRIGDVVARGDDGAAQDEDAGAVRADRTVPRGPDRRAPVCPARRRAGHGDRSERRGRRYPQPAPDQDGDDPRVHRHPVCGADPSRPHEAGEHGAPSRRRPRQCAGAVGGDRNQGEGPRRPLRGVCPSGAVRPLVAKPCRPPKERNADSEGSACPTTRHTTDRSFMDLLRIPRPPSPPLPLPPAPPARPAAASRPPSAPGAGARCWCAPPDARPPGGGTRAR